MKIISCLIIAVCLIMPASHATAKEIVKIGLITPLTGDIKAYGELGRKAFAMAVEDYNRRGKYTIVPVIMDDRNDATEGANAALKLITQDKVIAIIGAVTSKSAIPVGEIATKYKVPVIFGIATNPKVTIANGKRKPYVFRTCFVDAFQGVVAANYSLKDLHSKKAAVIYDAGNDFTKSLSEFFKTTYTKGNGTIVAYESYQRDDVDFSGIITKIAQKKPDLIFIPDYYNKAGLIAKQIREKGIKARLLGSDGWDSPDLITIGGNAIIDSYFVNHYSPDRKNPVTQSFIKKYKARYGVVPAAFGALTYDSTNVLLAALEKLKKPESDGLLKNLTSMKNYDGVTGYMSFDANGDSIKSVVIVRVDKDGFKYVTTVNP